jgi:hypothetical protein
MRYDLDWFESSEEEKSYVQYDFIDCWIVDCFSYALHGDQTYIFIVKESPHRV